MAFQQALSGLNTAGKAIDVTSHKYVSRVGNVILRSDHKTALIINTKEVA